jgi:hypothetical protein
VGELGNSRISEEIYLVGELTTFSIVTWESTRWGSSELAESLKENQKINQVELKTSRTS